MVFLQICRRHQTLFEGASAPVKLLLARKGFQRCRILHSHESKHLRVGKKEYSFPCGKYATGSREVLLVLIRGNQEIMTINNNNNQLSDEAEADYKLNNLAARG